MAARALVLFAHGSRDARWAEPFLRLQRMLQAQLSEVRVELAYLELMAPRLPELMTQLASTGTGTVTVVPVFFGQGGHVLRDLPLLVEQARTAHPAMEVRLAAAVGEDEGVLRALAAYCAAAAGAQAAA